MVTLCKILSKSQSALPHALISDCHMESVNNRMQKKKVWYRGMIDTDVQKKIPFHPMVKHISSGAASVQISAVSVIV